MYCGRVCSTEVEHLPRDSEVEGSIPAGRWAFFILSSFFPFLSDLSFLINHWVSLIRSLKKEVHLNELMWKVNKKYLAGLP